MQAVAEDIALWLWQVHVRLPGVGKKIEHIIFSALFKYIAFQNLEHAF